MTTNSDVDNLHDVYQAIYDSLNTAYWAASTIESKDRIHGVSELVFDVLTAINKTDLTSHTAEYDEIKKSISDLNSNLDKLKKDIDNLVQSVKIATDVSNDIDKAIGYAVKFFIEP